MIENIQNAYIVYRKFTAFLGLIIIIFGVVFGLVALYIIKVSSLQLLSIVIIFLPAILLKWLLNYNSRKASFIFDNNSIRVDITKGEEVKKSNNYPLTEIVGYQIQFPNRKFTDIMFKLKSGKRIPFSFYINKNKAENIDTGALINYFHDFIKNYNQSSVEKIKLLPSFYASTGGIISIIILISLFVGDIIAHIVVGKMGILPVTLLLVSGLIIQVLLRRHNDLKYYNKMK